MCGIAATFAYSGSAPALERDQLSRICDRLANRGPDGAGLWIADDERVGLAHRRLSIIDLSAAGAQPMWNAERTRCITFNGEIYNYQFLRKRLLERGRCLNSHSDTEVILELYAEKGAAMLDDLRGMYAFAIWDADKRTLFAARDPFGIKPLYYADDGRTIRLASQIKALVAGGRIDTAPEPGGHVGFFLWGNVPDPFTLYRGIRALPAGHTLTVRENEHPAVRSFCSIPEILREAQDGAASEDHSALANLHDALRDTAEHHLVSDVPVGIFLSSGRDSTTLAALVSESHRDVRSVTLAFEEFRGRPEDETPLAELVARQYRTDHTTVAITRADFEAESSKLFEAMDRPSVDGVNTYFVSLAARRAGLKVALSGLGGDELFGGYPSFSHIPQIVRTAQRFPALTSIGRTLRVVSSGAIKRFTSPKYAGIFEFGGTPAGAYLLRRGLFMPWELPRLFDADMVREGWESLHTLGRLAETYNGLRSDRLKVSSLELCWYMRHQLLYDSDWAGMAHSLEIRVPFVDIELLRRIAPLLASASPPSKGDMAAVPSQPLPAEVLNRPKTGFTVPVREWLVQSLPSASGTERGLRSWARQTYSRVAGPSTALKPSKGGQSRAARRVAVRL